MKILAVDTATKSCSVAIIDGELLLAESTVAFHQTHSRHLLNMIDSIVGEAGVEITELDGFAVSNGPGSFTGLRIGLASVKGLAFGLEKPVVCVSSLQALAFQCRQKPYLICPVIDARKHQVYYCRYRSANGKLKQETPERVAIPVEAVDDIREPSIFVGSGAKLYQQLITNELGQLAHFAPDSDHSIRASAIARLSLPRFRRKDTDNIDLLVPHYIRQSDAELSIGADKTLKF